MQLLGQELALNLRRLRLRHLEILLAVERHGSLTATAEALGVSQPAVSQWLAEIESALGVPLFVRGRQIQPSPYLPVALRHARRM
ncbi:MAG: LysR family transcriptional regulator, partial [Gammaproteobacteria bacterium]|nr:LysR family transcriptional regulator [Gammaproteobacteria bacterium]